MFRLHEDRNVGSVECIQFLSQLEQNIRGPLIIIWDRLQAHRSLALKRWLSNHRGIKLEYFPPYAPELNPVEYLWSYLKVNPLGNFAATDLEDLYRQSKSALCAIRKERNLLRSFIDHSPAKFFY